MSDHDRPPREGAPRPAVEWLEDRIPPGERKKRMLEKANELDYAELTSAVFTLVSTVEGFRNIRALYLGPSETDVKTATATARDEREARQAAWEKVHAIHQKFDLPNDLPSDWLRLIGVFKAALHPADGTPGLFESMYVAGDGASTFYAWAKAHYVDGRMLCAAGRRIDQSLGLLRHTNRLNTLNQQLARVTGKNFSPVIMAGFDFPEVQMAVHGVYQPIDQAMLALDPAEQGRRYDKVTAEVHRLLTQDPKCVLRLKRAGGSLFGDRWRANSFNRDNFDREYDDLKLQVEREVDEQLFGRGDELHISNQSATHDRMPWAAIVTARSRVDKTMYGHGVHGVDGRIIQALVPAEKLYRYAPAPHFAESEGRVIQTQSVHLISLDGPLLAVDTEPVKGPKAVSIFVDALMRTPTALTVKNTDLIDVTVPRLVTCSLELLQPPPFDLREWYIQRCIDAGFITSVAEAKTHAQKLTLTLADLFPDSAEQELITEIEHDYPATLTVKGKPYHLTYERNPGHNPPLQVIMTLPIGQEGREHFLSLSPADLATVGPSTTPIALTFALGYGSRQQRFADLIAAQDVIDPEFLDRQWDAYVFKNDQEIFEIRLDWKETLPETITFSNRESPFPVYGHDRRGTEYYPVPAYQHIGNEVFAKVVRKNMQQALETTMAARRALTEYMKQQERKIFLQEHGGPLREQAMTELNALLDEETALREDAWAQIVFHRMPDALMRGLTETILRDDIQANPDRVLSQLKRIRERRAHGKQLAGLCARAQALEHQLHPLPYPAEFNLGNRPFDWSTYWSDLRRPLPGLADVQAAIDWLLPQVNAVIAEQAESKRRLDADMAAWTERRAAFDAQPPAELFTVIKPLHTEAVQLVTRLQRQINRVPRRGLLGKRADYINNKMFGLRGRHASDLMSFARDNKVREPFMDEGLDPATTMTGLLEHLRIRPASLVDDLSNRVEHLRRRAADIAEVIKPFEAELEP